MDPMDEIDAACSQDPPKLRRRRSASRARHIRTAERAPADAKKMADAIAACGSADGGNMDVQCTVQGVTHRGAVKFKVLKLEELTGSMIDRWRFLCTSRGYFPEIHFATSQSEATIVCTPISTSCSACETPLRLLRAVHPLTAAFLVLLGANVARHALVLL